jgi:hypothetical protein
MNKNRFSTNAIKLLELIQKGELPAERLTPRMRKIIIRYFMENDLTFSSSAVGEQLAITQQQVNRIRKALIRNSEYLIDEIDVKSIAVNLKLRKDQLQRKAMAKEDYALVWTIEKDFASVMQGLGFVYRAPATLNVRVTQQQDFQIQLKELYSELGVPTREQFIALLEAALGNGGNGRKLISETAGSGTKPATTVDRGAKEKRS